MASRPYTLGIWTVKPGREDDFVSAWTEFAGWTEGHVPGSGRGTLTRDLEDPQRFVSFGPWESLEAIDAWRAMDGWVERVGRIRELLQGFEAMTLEAVVERG